MEPEGEASGFTSAALSLDSPVSRGPKGLGATTRGCSSRGPKGLGSYVGAGVATLAPYLLGPEVAANTFAQNAALQGAQNGDSFGRNLAGAALQGAAGVAGAPEARMVEDALHGIAKGAVTHAMLHGALYGAAGGAASGAGQSITNDQTLAQGFQTVAAQPGQGGQGRLQHGGAQLKGQQVPGFLVRRLGAGHHIHTLHQVAQCLARLHGPNRIAQGHVTRNPSGQSGQHGQHKASRQPQAEIAPRTAASASASMARWRAISTSSAKSSGSSDFQRMAFPLAGCTSPSRQACSA